MKALLVAICESRNKEYGNRGYKELKAALGVRDRSRAVSTKVKALLRVEAECEVLSFEVKICES